jgi:hypothetical protein
MGHEIDSQKAKQSVSHSASLALPLFYCYHPKVKGSHYTPWKSIATHLLSLALRCIEIVSTTIPYAVDLKADPYGGTRWRCLVIYIYLIRLRLHLYLALSIFISVQQCNDQ